MRRRPASRRVRRIRRAGLVALATLGAFLLAVVLCFAVPHDDPLPRHADAVVVLGPPTTERVRTAMAMLQEGRVDEVVFSLSHDARTPGSWSNAALRVCERTPHTECVVAVPHTTQGEARLIARLAKDRGWHTVVAVTQQAHALRAGLILRRCLTARLAVRTSAEQPYGGMLYELAYQTAASAKALLSPGC